MDYKLTLFNLAPDTDLKDLAEGIIENYGEDFDAPRGDFTAEPVGDTVEIVAKDVTGGDMMVLREDIYRDFGDEDDSMMVRASRRDAGGSWFPADLDADE